MKRLLLVEDSRGVRTLLQHYLSPHFLVTLAGDGRQGLTLASQERFDLILSDINLPELTGLELFAAVRKQADPPRVVLMTDADVDGYLPAALELEAQHIIAKAVFKYDMDGTMRLLRDLERNQVFGMHRRLGVGGEVRTCVVTSEEEVPDVLEHCNKLLVRFPRRNVYRRLLPELVRNALRHGRRQGGTGGDHLHISIGADWNRVGIGVSDSGGNLSWRKVLEVLVGRLPTARDLDEPVHGLVGSRRLMDQTFFNLAPGLQTEILCFDFLSGYRGSKSLHLSQTPHPLL